MVGILEEIFIKINKKRGNNMRVDFIITCGMLNFAL